LRELQAELAAKALDAHTSHVQAINELCHQAARKGAGWRVWVSDSRVQTNGEDGMRLVYDTVFLPPGASATPGLGTIYGPFTAE
jgi:hypothetical protein